MVNEHIVITSLLSIASWELSSSFNSTKRKYPAHHFSGARVGSGPALSGSCCKRGSSGTNKHAIKQTNKNPSFHQKKIVENWGLDNGNKGCGGDQPNAETPQDWKI